MKRAAGGVGRERGTNAIDPIAPHSSFSQIYKQKYYVKPEGRPELGCT